MKRGFVQPQVEVTSRITSGYSLRFVASKVWAIGPLSSRMEPKFHSFETNCSVDCPKAPKWQITSVVSSM